MHPDSRVAEARFGKVNFEPATERGARPGRTADRISIFLKQRLLDNGPVATSLRIVSGQRCSQEGGGLRSSRNTDESGRRKSRRRC